MKRLLVYAFSLGMVLPISAQSPYRENLPEVLPAPTQPTTDAVGIVAHFRKAYAAHSRPRMVIFWNRDFTGQIATQYDRYTSKDVQKDTDSTTITRSAADPFGDLSATSQSGSTHIRTETHSGQSPVTTDDATASDSQDPVTWQCESAFIEAFVRVPTKLIDRTTIMRLSKRSLAAGERENIQAIEAAAINAKADIILEVLVQPDQRTISNALFKVNVRDVKSGAIIIQFTTSAVPVEASNTHYVAGPEGFTRVHGSVTIDDVGHKLALETMDRLTTVWRR
jgi:hypothetical protein